MKKKSKVFFSNIWAISSHRKPQKLKKRFSEMSIFSLFWPEFFLSSLIFGSRGGDRFLDARGGASPPPSPMCAGWHIYFFVNVSKNWKVPFCINTCLFEYFSSLTPAKAMLLISLRCQYVLCSPLRCPRPVVLLQQAPVPDRGLPERGHVRLSQVRAAVQAGSQDEEHQAKDIPGRSHHPLESNIFSIISNISFF